MAAKIKEGMTGGQVADIIEQNFENLEDKFQQLSDQFDHTKEDINRTLDEYQSQVDDAYGSIVTQVDEEDTTTDKGKIKLKDRAYEPDKFSGKGYKILRKNIVCNTETGESKNILTQDMINQSNTVYEIRYDFDLNGETINIPEGCTLKFEGGSLNNGVINGVSTTIKALKDVIFDNITLSGSFNSKAAYGEWFSDNTDDNKILHNLFLISNIVYLEPNREYHLTQCLTFNKQNTTLYGNNAAIYLENNLINNGQRAEAFWVEADTSIYNLNVISNLTDKLAITDDFKVFWMGDNYNLNIDGVNFTHTKLVSESYIIIYFLSNNKNVSIKNGRYIINTGDTKGGFCWIYPRVNNSVFTLENLYIEQYCGDEAIAISNKDETAQVGCSAIINNVHIKYKSPKNTIPLNLGNNTNNVNNFYVSNLTLEIQEDSYQVYSLGLGATNTTINNYYFNNCKFINPTNTYLFIRPSFNENEGGYMNIVFNNCHIEDNSSYFFGVAPGIYNKNVNITFESCYIKLQRGFFGQNSSGSTSIEGTYKFYNCYIEFNYRFMFNSGGEGLFSSRFEFYNNTINYLNSNFTFDETYNLGNITYTNPGYFRASNNKLLFNGIVYDFTFNTEFNDKTIYYRVGNTLTPGFICTIGQSNVSQVGSFCGKSKEISIHFITESSNFTVKYNTSDNHYYSLGLFRKLSVVDDDSEYCYNVPIIGGIFKRDKANFNTYYTPDIMSIASENRAKEGDIMYNKETQKLIIFYNSSTYKEINLLNADSPLGGPNTSRPADPIRGLCYYDTNLAKPIWWTGTKWVDATGADV